LIGSAALVLALLFRVSSCELIVLVVVIGWVITLEIVNTVVEHMVDLLKPEFHAHARIVKDLASGAVLVFSIAAAVVAAVVFVPRFVASFYQLAEWMVG